MDDQEIKQAIDVCRPDTDDPCLPEISALDDLIQHDEGTRRLYEKTQQCDAAIAGAFRDISVPDGLSDRLLAAVGEHATPAREASICNVEDLSETAGEAEATARSTRPSRLTRWHYVGIGLSTVAAAAAICLVLIRHHGRGIILPDALPAQVADWMQQVDRADWNKDLAHLDCQKRPFDGRIRVSPRRWCRVKTGYDSRTVVYDLAKPGERYAFVFCLRSGVDQPTLPTVPTAIPTTGGKVIAAWQRGGVVYVLAVKGSMRRYQRLVDSRMIIG